MDRHEQNFLSHWLFRGSYVSSWIRRKREHSIVNFWGGLHLTQLSDIWGFVDKHNVIKRRWGLRFVVRLIPTTEAGYLIAQWSRGNAVESIGILTVWNNTRKWNVETVLSWLESHGGSYPALLFYFHYITRVWHFRNVTPVSKTSPLPPCYFIRRPPSGEYTSPTCGKNGEVALSESSDRRVPSWRPTPSPTCDNTGSRW